MTLIVRTATTPGGVASAVTNTVHQLDADMPMRNILTMDDVVATSLSQQRFDTLLLGAFAGLALVLAAIGIYSVLSYSVKRRVGEIGIRMALGARLGDVLRLVIIEGMKPTLLGLAIGVIAALAFGHVMSSLIYQIAPSDPLTFLTVAVLLAAVGFLATVIPAYRASKVDPMVALRDE
jgi:ABC-type antimicrobial peptide transport system permease subunit